MIETTTLLYELDQRLNRVATNKHQYIPDEDKLIALNNSQVKLIKQKVSLNNNYKLGLDSFKKRYQDLENLIVPHEPLKVRKDDTYLHKYVSDLTDTKNTYMFLVDVFYLCDKGNCKNRVVSTFQARHADIHVIINNTNTTPSFEYQEAPYTLTDSNLEFYTDGSFIPTAAHISYLRYPKEIDISGYEKFDGSPSVDQNCELEYYLKDELLDLAQLDLAMATENDNQVRYSTLRTQTNE